MYLDLAIMKTKQTLTSSDPNNVPSLGQLGHAQKMEKNWNKQGSQKFRSCIDGKENTILIDNSMVPIHVILIWKSYPSTLLG